MLLFFVFQPLIHALILCPVMMNKMFLILLLSMLPRSSKKTSIICNKVFCCKALSMFASGIDMY